MPAAPDAPCVVCGTPRPAPWLVARDALLGGRRRWRVVRCRRCGLGVVAPLPTPTELDAAYPATFDPYVKPYKDPKPLGSLARAWCETRWGWPRRGAAPGPFRRVLAACVVPFLRLRPVPFRGQGRWLDVGCGAGAALHRTAALEPAFRPRGIERDAGAVERARAHGLDVTRADFPRTDLPAAVFDVVTLSHVLEHIPDPMAALHEVARLLAPGGCAVVAVPNRHGVWARWLGARWLALDVPRHLYHFTPQALRLAASRAGLRVAWVRHEGTQGPWDVWKRALVGAGLLPEGRSLRGAVLRAPVRLATMFLDVFGGADQVAVGLERAPRAEFAAESRNHSTVGSSV